MAITKTEQGKEFTADEYFYVGNPKMPTTWKLRKVNDDHEIDMTHLGQAASALGPNPAHGKGVRDIPDSEKSRIKKEIVREMKKLGRKEEEIKKDFPWLS